MTGLEILLILIVLGALLLLIYYFFRGSKTISVTRPLETRIDEYLDQRFEALINEWSLTTRPQLRRFKEQKSPLLTEDEARVAALKALESEMKATLDHLEERLDALEKELVKTGTGATKRKA